MSSTLMKLPLLLQNQRKRRQQRNPELKRLRHTPPLHLLMLNRQQIFRQIPRPFQQFLTLRYQLAQLLALCRLLTLAQSQLRSQGHHFSVVECAKRNHSPNRYAKRLRPLTDMISA